MAEDLPPTALHRPNEWTTVDSAEVSKFFADEIPPDAIVNVAVRPQLGQVFAIHRPGEELAKGFILSHGNDEFPGGKAEDWADGRPSIPVNELAL